MNSQICPACHSNKPYKNGFNVLKNGLKIQKYHCPDCYKNFQKLKPEQ